MPLKALLNGNPVYASSVAGTGEYNCAECGTGMHYRRAFKRDDGARVQAHFAHNPVSVGGIPRNCSSVGQSEEHMNAKETLRVNAPVHFKWLSGVVGDVEVPLENRRADVLFTLPNGTRVVFEPQFTKIPRRQIAERTNDYHAMGCHVIWCFPQKRKDLSFWARDHFYCIGVLDDDGNAVKFYGNINPLQNAPSLRKPFDDEAIFNSIETTVPAFSEVPWGEYQPGVYHKPDPMPSIAISPRGQTHDAYRAWMSSGSIGLGLWLANYKEATTGHRNYTVEEYGQWVAECRTLEYDHTGENNEFCIVK